MSLSWLQIHKVKDCVFQCLLVLVLFLGVWACSVNGVDTPTAASQATQTIAAIPTSTSTPIPTPTAPRPMAVLVAPPGADPEQVESLQVALSELAVQDGFDFQVQEKFTTPAPNLSVKIAVVLAPDPGVAGLGTEYPETQFLAVNIPGVEPAQNLSVIRGQEGRQDQPGFLAGYLAAVLTPEWRVGMISSAGADEGSAAWQGFSNGVVFYCGLCRPAVPPFYQYPLLAEVPAAASLEESQAAADTVINSAVKTVYVVPGAGDTSLLEYLAQAGVNIIGGVTPPPPVRSQWVATITVDLNSAIRQAWPRLVNGESGFAIDAPIYLIDRNETLFSIGRQRLVQKMLEDLLAGYIGTGVDR